MLYEDEFSLSNTATVGYQWGAKGKQPQVLCKQSKREGQTAFGSFNYDTGQMTVSFAEREATAKLLKSISKRCCTNTGIHQKSLWYWIM